MVFANISNDSKIALSVCCIGLLTVCACGSERSAPEGKALSADALYRQHCVVCHGTDGRLALNGAADLSQSTLSLQERIQQIAMGKNTMPPFGALLKEEEILAIAQYLETFRK